MYRRNFAALLLIAASSIALPAQYRVDEKALSTAPSTGLRSIDGEEIPLIKLDSIGLDNRLVDSTLQVYSTTRFLPFALERKLPKKIEGSYRKSSDGRIFWQVAIKSPGALGLGLQLRNVALPPGGRLYLRGAGIEKGAYTAESFSTERVDFPPLKGDSLVLEYDFPEGVTGEDQCKLPFTIEQVYHDYMGVGSLLSASGRHALGEPFFNSGGQALERLLCAPEIANYPELVATTSRGVVLMVIEGRGLATGSLINNTNRDGRPYVLTSSHCINGNFAYEKLNDSLRLKAVSDAASSIVFFFNFQSPVGDHTLRATEEQSLAGASLVAYNPAVDMALVEIEGLPLNSAGVRAIPRSYRPYFNGWQLAEQPQAPFYCIHHPMGSTKRYSEVEERELFRHTYTTNLSSIERKTFNNDSHWFVSRWAVGTTAGGSSGSPLFDKDGLIIGALSGGMSTCTSPMGDDYWALSAAWESSISLENLSAFLDPSSSGVSSLEAYDPEQDRPVLRVGPFMKRHSLRDLSAYTTKGNTLGLANRFSLSEGDEVLGAYICFVGSDLLERSFPQVAFTFALTNGSERSVASLSETNFVAYDLDRFKANLDPFIERKRTLAGDSCEVFIPFESFRVPQGGVYQLALFSTAEGLSQLQLLSADVRKQLFNRGRQNESYVFDGSSWTRLEDRSLWIDLLVRPKEAPGEDDSQADGVEMFLTKDRVFHLYFSERDYTSRRATLRLYHLSGKLAHQQSVSYKGSLTYNLPSYISPGVYVLSVDWGRGRRAIKVSLE